MALTKFASFESAEVLDIKGTRTRQHSASLDKVADYENYRTGDGYLYVRIRAISSRTNRNHDGWPSIELAGSKEIFDRHHSAGGFTVEAAQGNPEYGFATFIGKPIFVDHHNSNPKKARGVIVDAKFNVLDHKTATKHDSYWGSHDVDHEHLPPSEVELLLEVDAKSFPRLAKAILDGDLDGFSMGADVDYSKCSHCGHIATAPDEYCSHVMMKGAHHDFKTADGKRVSKKSYENCFPPDTPILLADGSTLPIDQITTDHYVLDHRGHPQRVQHIHMRNADELLYQIHHVGQGTRRPLRITANHPVLAIRSPSWASKLQIQDLLHKQALAPEFIPASEIKTGDFVAEINPSHREITRTWCFSDLFPKPVNLGDHATADITQDETFRPTGAYKDWTRRACQGCGSFMELHPSETARIFCSSRCYGDFRKGKFYGGIEATPIKNHVTLDWNFGRWCGWYLAEGNISYNNGRPMSVAFSLHKNEVNYAEEIERLGKDLFGLTAHHATIGENGRTVVFYNVNLAGVMEAFGTSSYDKHLPSALLTGPLTFIEGVVTAHEHGDGHHNPDGVRSYEHQHITASSILGDQLYNMHLWLGHTPSHHLDQPTIQNKRTVPAHVIKNATGGRNRGRFSYDHWDFRQVTAVDKVSYHGPVHNLTVDNSHTFIANGLGVHNCYGVKFFEISAVFDPADETALAREVRAAVNKEAGIDARDPMQNYHSQVADLAMAYQMKGVDSATARDMAERKVKRDMGLGGNEGYRAPHEMGDMPQHGQLPNWRMDPWPQEATIPTEPLNDPRWSKTAENDLPQEMHTRAPDELDTLRDEQLCPICGNDMEGETCSVCGYVEPPKEFDNPDLGKAQEIREKMKAEEEAQSTQPQTAQQPGGMPQQGGPNESTPASPMSPTKAPSTAKVKSDMFNWTPKLHPKTAARINQTERPIGAPRPASNEPQNVTVTKDQTVPVTSAMRTAQDLINRANQRTAEGPTPPNAGETDAHKRVNVMDVGGVDVASNEEASKSNSESGKPAPHKQVDVTGIGGVMEGVEADRTESLPTAGRDGDDAGFNTDKTTDDSGPTKTFDDKDGQHPGVTDPVTSETPYWVDESKWSARQAYENGPFEKLDQQDPSDPLVGGGAKSGTDPADPIGRKDTDRIDVMDYATSPDNNSGPTKTWSGTDGNGVTKQQPPVTNEDQEWGGIKVPDVTLHTNAPSNSTVSSRISLSALRLAEAEIELGLTPREDKFNRIMALDSEDPHVVQAKLEALAQVKTAGLAKLTQHRQAGLARMPRAFGRNTAAPDGFQRVATGAEQVEKAPIDDAALDAGLFWR